MQTYNDSTLIPSYTWVHWSPVLLGQPRSRSTPPRQSRFCSTMAAVFNSRRDCLKAVTTRKSKSRLWAVFAAFAGSGIEPDSSGYASLYDFHRVTQKMSDVGAGLCLYPSAFAEWGTCRLVSTPSSRLLQRLGSVFPTLSSKGSPNLTGYP